MLDYGYYQKEDPWFNYEIWHSNGHPFRGPIPILEKDYISFLGAGQVFGRYASFPFPTLIHNFLGVECANFGTAGHGPSSPFFVDNLDVINRGQLAVVTVMSGRSVSNKYWTAWSNHGKNEITGEHCVGQVFWEYIINKFETDKIIELVLETRVQYMKEFKELFRAITVPVIFLFMSKFGYSDNTIDTTDTNTLFGRFPQLIDKDTIMNIAEEADEFVEIIYQSEPERFPFPQENKYAQEFLGEPKRVMTHNSYYPTTEEHFAVYDTLAPVIKKILDN